jgi:hypothetical protein
MIFTILNCIAKALNRRKLFMAGSLVALLLLFFLGGCSPARLVMSPLLHPMTLSLESQTDLELLRDGAPAVLLMLDALITADPANKQFLMAGARAYASYAVIVFEHGEEVRAARLSGKAKEYGVALLNTFPELKDTYPESLIDFRRGLAAFRKKDVAYLYWGGQALATWIAYQNGSPAAMIDLPKVEEIMSRVVELDETFYYGSAHIFLGSYFGARPKMFGGSPEKSKLHFERALEIGKRRFLLAQVLYAETYARILFDRDLFENLLREVVDYPLDGAPELSSGNQLAKMMARKRLARIDEFF